MRRPSIIPADLTDEELEDALKYWETVVSSRGIYLIWKKPSRRKPLWYRRLLVMLQTEKKWREIEKEAQEQ